MNDQVLAFKALHKGQVHMEENLRLIMHNIGLRTVDDTEREVESDRDAEMIDNDEMEKGKETAVEKQQ